MARWGDREIGRNFVIVPYMQIESGWTLTDDELGNLFDRMVCERTLKTVFYDGSVTLKSQFLDYFKKGDILPVGAWTSDLDPLVWIWLTGIHNETAFIHFCTFGDRRVRLKIDAASHIVKKILEFFEVLIGVTPEIFQAASHFACLAGFKILGTIPRMLYLPYERKRVGAIISYLGRS